MKYVKYFPTINDWKQSVYLNTLDYPNISSVAGQKRALYIHRPEKQYLIFRVLTSGKLLWKTTDLTYIRPIKVSLNGIDWTTIEPTVEGAEITLSQGDVLRVQGFNTGYCRNTSIYHSFGSSDGLTFNLSGNILTLLKDGLNTTSLGGGKFYKLFDGCTGVIDASQLSIPVTSIGTQACAYMFNGCTGLTRGPVLPATQIGQSGYARMFNGCTSLTVAPELPATTLGTGCYQFMFCGCSSLTAAVNLPATTLAAGCYLGMFQECTSLRTAMTTLPALVIPENGYRQMFNGCTSLIAAPNISATSMTGTYTCTMMFYGCTSMTTGPSALSSLNVTYRSYYSMFNGCTALLATPTFGFTSVDEEGCVFMFYYCTSMTTAADIICTTLNGPRVFESMFRECYNLSRYPARLPATTLTYMCYYSMFRECYGNDPIPPELPATVMAEGCYGSMFYSSIIGAYPELPATTLAVECYARMFSDSRNIQNTLSHAPVLPATVLCNMCYETLFNGCSAINWVKTAYINEVSGATTNMLNGVSATGTYLKNAEATWTTTGADGVPTGWTVETWTP